MGRASANRIGRAVIAGAVLLLHLAVLWLLLQPVNHPIGSENEPETAIAMIIEQARRRNLQFGPVSIHVKVIRLRVNLERLAPNIQDISVEERKPPRQVSNLEAAASAPLPKSAKPGLDGEAAQSTGHSGGGNDLTLLERVTRSIPSSLPAGMRREP